ncbi:MAG TPA: DNA cytosine methyltransferase [Oscillatoriaceae cyanobacterium M33_DOE_052]|uniref:Cytosine-specific methyltransferase n=1 Tax=Planktothricoides sp. SpSt-374 TaxID=2282167 RepID=A0A7C3ZMI7_9CYAN|nr:DNA cytosine methyltransferase [Oscillatoriaceae cyanobacterium M33_DOE_052]
MFSALSLFSGAGGMDLGVRQAGFEVRACLEMDPYCCETLRSAIARDNLKTVVIEQDIRKIEPLDLRKELNLKFGHLDLLFGGSPCQSFSQAGKRASLDDERGWLIFEFVRLAEIFYPKFIIIEQVKGFLKAPDNYGQIGGVCQLLTTQLQALGYEVKIQLINAASYGVSQYRERVFLVATQPGMNFSFPPPTHGKPNEQLCLFPLQPYVTLRESITGLGRPSQNKQQPPEDGHLDVTPPGDIKRIHGVPEGSFLAGEKHLPEQQRGKLTAKDTTKFRRLSFSEPSLTLRCGEIFFHPREDRYLTPREYMRIHGYPDDYLLKGPIRGRSGTVRHLDQHRQIANSVPPPVARAIAAEVAKSLKSQVLASAISAGDR